MCCELQVRKYQKNFNLHDFQDNSKFQSFFGGRRGNFEFLKTELFSYFFPLFIKRVPYARINSLQIYPLLIQKHSLKRKEVDLQEIRLRSIYSIFHFFACGLFEKAVYSRRWSIQLTFQPSSQQSDQMNQKIMNFYLLMSSLKLTL